jgi:hypothetical protein
LQKGKVAVINVDSGLISIEITREHPARGPTVIVCSPEMASEGMPASLINGNFYPERLDVTVIV